jgi:hypothetical protein
MSRVGEKVKKAYTSNGTEIIPLKGATLTEHPSEYILTKLSNQATKVFIQEFYLKGYFPYDTVLVSGDYLRTVYDNETYMVMNLNNETFRNEIIQRHATLYKINNTVKVQRKVMVLNPSTFVDEPTWVDQYDLDIPCVVTNTRFGAEVSDYNNIGEVLLDALLVYVSRHYDIREFDRLVFGTGETMMVENVDKYNYGFAYELKMTQDNR